jgi:hypothetical protein
VALSRPDELHHQHGANDTTAAARGAAKAIYRPVISIVLFWESVNQQFITYQSVPKKIVEESLAIFGEQPVTISDLRTC